MTFNIHWGEGGDGVYDLERIAAVIREQRPDYVALQELHFHTSEFPENQASALAQRTSMHSFFHPVIAGTPRDRDGPGSYGNAILTREPIAQTKICEFPIGTGYSRSQEARGACAVRTASDPFWFVSTHLGCDITLYEQSAALAPLEEFVSSLPTETVVMGGDFNCWSVMSAPRTLVGSNGWTDLWYEWGIQNGCGYFDGCTMPAWWPYQRIDYLFLRGPRLVPHDAAVVCLTPPYPSDHNPVVANLRVLPPVITPRLRSMDLDLVKS